MGAFPDEPLTTFLRAGRFEAARGLLFEQRPMRLSDPEGYDVLDAELAFETGDEERAARLAAECLERKPRKDFAARLHRTIGLCLFNVGDSAGAMTHIEAARKCCPPRERYLAVVELTSLELALKLTPLEIALSKVHELRRLVANAGDPHLIALLRLYVARCEARRNGLAEVQRHHDLIARLLEGYPNLWLQGLLSLDRSVIAMLLGDIDSALFAARDALDLSEQSGHRHSQAAAHINLSHILERRNDFEAARRHLAAGAQRAGTNCHLRRALTDSWANLLLTTGDLQGCESALEEARVQASRETAARPHWDALTEIYSRARLAQTQGRWTDAVTDLSSGLQLADASNDTIWRHRLLRTRSKCSAVLGDDGSALRDFVSTTDGASDPQTLAEYEATAAVLGCRRDSSRATEQMQRAIRIARTAGNLGLCDDLRQGFPADLVEGRSSLASPTLDAAVALLDLAGHPHILGAEAVALMRGSACARRLALVAKGPAAIRIVDAVDWESAEAIAAAKAPNDTVEHLTLGRRGEESWFLVVEPKRELEPYCTFAAIRRLLALAVSLDGYRRDEKQRAALWPADALDGDAECVWASEQMAEVLTTARRIATAPLPVLITGETGTGKEMVARAIHRASERADKPFLPFNCAAVPREMLESQLFGYRKGAFTSADTGFQGIIRSAAGGTLFLDEIGEIGADIQPKLLRFLETHEIHPLGEPHPIRVDVRVIAATNASVERLIADGKFRDDLFYRLNVMRLTLPPLRERREEIPPLTQHYIRKYSDEQRKGRLTLSDETLEYLLLFSWPGNVRQLANEIRRMVALADPDSTLTPSMLSPEIQASRRTVAVPPVLDIEARVSLDQPMPVAVEMLEQLMVRRALDRTHGRVEEASRLLGISRKGLFLKRRRWGLSHAS